MNILRFAAVVTTAFAFHGPAQAADVLGGDEKIACEVILCLSSGSRPSECSPPLSHFYSIKAKRPDKTIRKRINFLKLCPDGGGVPDSYRTVLATSGQICDMPSLLGYLNAPANGAGGGPGRRAIPAHCQLYADHRWTHEIALPVRQQWCATFSLGEGDRENRCIYRWIDPRQSAPVLTDAQVRDLIENEWPKQNQYADSGR